MHLVKVRWPGIGNIGLVVQLLMSTGLAPIYWSTGSPSPMNLIADMAETLGYVIGALLVVFFLLIPAPSGRAITKLMVLLTGVVEKMANADDLETCMELDSQTGQLIVPLDVLLLTSKVDLDVYGRPHVFPSRAFQQLYQQIGFLSRLMVHRSRVDRSNVPEIDDLHAAQQEALHSIGACLSGSNHDVDVERWDMVLQNHHHLAWVTYSTLQLLLEEKTATNREAIIVEAVSCWFIAKAMEGLAGCFPDAALTEIRRDNSIDWKFIATEMTRVTKPQALEEALKDSGTQPPSSGSGHGKVPVSPSKAVVLPIISSPPASPATSRNPFLFRMAEATGLHSHHIILSCQATGSFLVACILTFNSTTYKALGETVSYIFVAIIVLSIVTYSGVVLKARQRLCGTVIGVIVVILITAFNYLVAGLSYKNTTTSLALSCTLLAVYTGLSLATREAFKPDYQYALQLAIFTPPLLFTYDLDDAGDSVWSSFGFRIGNNLIGIGLVTVFSLMYPVTSRTYIRHTVAELLEELGHCAEGFFESF